MHTYLAAAANCTTGTWSQRWKCGWNEPATSAGHAGYAVGHDVLPALLVLAIVILAVRTVRKRRTRAGASPGPARVAARR